MPKVSYMGIPGGIDTHKQCRIDHDEDVNIDMITNKFLPQPGEKIDAQVIEMKKSETMSEIFNTECFNENSKIRIQRPGDKENYVRKKIPLQRSLSSSSTFSSSPFPQGSNYKYNKCNDIKRIDNPYI
nr:uncharacterized protein LOC124809557 [Hydra vulgaris]